MSFEILTSYLHWNVCIDKPKKYTTCLLWACLRESCQCNIQIFFQDDRKKEVVKVSSLISYRIYGNELLFCTVSLFNDSSFGLGCRMNTQQMKKKSGEFSVMFCVCVCHTRHGALSAPSICLQKSINTQTS